MNSYLVTGACGFLGSFIVSHLKSFAKVITLGLESENEIEANITDEMPTLPATDVVVHAAGLAHTIPKTEADKQRFMDINYQGTVNLCNSLERDGTASKIRTFVFISTVSVYGLEIGEKISETDELKGESPYAVSKIKAEAFLREWSEKHHCNLVILRLPLVIGSNPVGNLAKMIEGIKSKKYVNINGGKARKSMVLAEDIAELIGRLDKHNGTFNLTDNYDPSFKELSDCVSQKLGQSKPLNLPLFVAKPLGWVGDVFSFFPVNSDVISKMTSDLTFDSSQAVKHLDWRPRSVLKNFDIVFEKS